MRNPLLVEISLSKVRLLCHNVEREAQSDEDNPESDATYASVSEGKGNSSEKRTDYKVQQKDIKLLSKQE